MTTTAVPTVPAPAATAPGAPAAPAPRQRFDEKHVRLTVLLRALDAAGLADQLAASRGLLARADGILAAEKRGTAAGRGVRDGMVADLVSGKVDLDEAASRVAAVTAWIGGPHYREDQAPAPARDLTERAVRELRRQAYGAVRSDVLAVHGVLAGRAAAAVRAGVTAGRQLVDVPTIVAALKPRKAPAGTTVLVGAVHHPAPPAAPSLDGVPRLAIEDIEHDPVRMGHWSAASVALRELSAVFELVGMLHGVGGGSSSLYAGDADQVAADLMERALPAQAHLAVTDALGWRPGLHLVEPGDHSRRVVVGGVVIRGAANAAAEMRHAASLAGLQVAR